MPNLLSPSPLSLFLTHFRCMVSYTESCKCFSTSCIFRVVVSRLPHILYAMNIQSQFSKLPFWSPQPFPSGLFGPLINYTINFLAYLRPFRIWLPPTLFLPHLFSFFSSPPLPDYIPLSLQLRSLAMPGPSPPCHSFCLVCASHHLIISSATTPSVKPFQISSGQNLVVFGLLP